MHGRVELDWTGGKGIRGIARKRTKGLSQRPQHQPIARRAQAAAQFSRTDLAPVELAHDFD